MIDPGWTRRRHARLAYLARARRDRRIRDSLWWQRSACSHWRTCRHSYCARARYGALLAREAEALVQRLQKGA